MTQNAVQIIDDARKRGAIIYSAANLQTPPLFKVEVTEITSKPAEFHNIQGKFMASKAVVDRIGDAAGINFIDNNCGVTTETRDDSFGKRTVFIGRAQGKIRISDGSWRESAVEEYEFDPKLRAMAEGGSQSKELEYMKVGRQRASTGARVRVVRQLTGMPVTLTKEEVDRPLVFSRIVQNTDYILATPEGRQMAVANALGMAQQLYGPRPAQLTAPEVSPEPESTEPRNVTPATDLGFASDAEEFPNPFRAALVDVLKRYRGDLGQKAIAAFESALADEKTSDQTFANYLEQTKGFLASKGIDMTVRMPA